MNDIQAELMALIDKAAPLYPLDEDDPKKAKLAALVDRINEIRAVEAEMKMRGAWPPEVESRVSPAVLAVVEGSDARYGDEVDETAKRKPGRPRKEA